MYTTHTQTKWYRLFSCGLSALFAATLLVSCSTSDYSRIPKSPFLAHYQPCTVERVPFCSYWDNLTDEEWNKGIQRTRKVYLKPVTLEHLQRDGRTMENAEEMEQLRQYFDTRLREEYAKAAKANPGLIVVQHPDPQAAVLEVAILSAHPVRVDKNATILIGNKLLGGGMVWKWLFSNRDEQLGHISMGARLLSPNGKLLAEMADFEYGMESLTGLVALDTKNFRPFAYQRRTIDTWAEQLAELTVTSTVQNVEDPLFSLNPF